MTVDRRGHVAVFDAPEPSGPWSTVLFQQDSNRWGSKVIIATFANEWLGADGRRFVVVHTKDDSWASLEGEFTVARADPPAAGRRPIRPALSSLHWMDARESILRKARDGDNWPVTWADDDAFYTTWGDGTGFPPRVETKLSMGFARVTGSPHDFTGVNVRSDAERLGQGRASKKGWGAACGQSAVSLARTRRPPRSNGAAGLVTHNHSKTWSVRGLEVRRVRHDGLRQLRQELRRAPRRLRVCLLA